MSKILKKYWPILLIIILSTIIVWPLFLPGYFFHHDDLQVMRIFEMRKCLEDFQIPCRWVPDMGYGNGYPLFNYYGVLPYYVGAVLSTIFGFVGAAKALFFIPLVLGGVAMYFLGKELFGEYGGFLAGVLYQFAPYRALDSYVRGAIAESFALAITPLVFYLSLRLIKEKSLFNFLGLAISLGLFLMNHNIMSMFFIPTLFIWVGFWMFKLERRNWKSILISFGLGISLAAFFISPAFLEKSLVKTESLLSGGTDFRAHFVTVSQLFLDRDWEYGGSFFGPDDTISFQIGWPHWWLVIISLWLIVYGLLFNKKLNNLRLWGFLIGIFIFSIFMAHNKSTFIWESISLVQYTQFPWRFLSLTIFSVSLIGGMLVSFFSRKIRLIVMIFMTLITVILNYNFFKPKDFYPWVDDKVKLSDPLWEIQQKAGILDYLPKTAWLEPPSRAPSSPEIRKGKAYIENFNIKTKSFDLLIKVTEDATIEVPILDFPNWTIFINDKKYPHYYDKIWGRISLDLGQGEYQIKGVLKDTVVRSIANFITLIALVLVILMLIYRRKITKWI